ncbi:hypothetical protein [Fictibacillus sp. KU28468]|uniref:hypothetical protein n=1 Tax=Fictibacillus sp. KU28468 TaxID=2991053 RepID=UPI00223D873B|nr:hypothetical protein [Fictibacillus sp. KU28468]UZJ80550.1 hypothetical protein OKX00_08910 [Fictibacillus sp. KU28468]
MGFTVTKTLRNTSTSEDQLKTEIIHALEDKFQCQSKDNGNVLEVSLIPRSAGKFIKSKGKVRITYQDGRAKLNFGGKHAPTGRGYFSLVLSAVLIPFVGLGLIFFIISLIQMNKGSKSNERDINEAFNEVSNFLNTNAV